MKQLESGEDEKVFSENISEHSIQTEVIDKDIRFSEHFWN